VEQFSLRVLLSNSGGHLHCGRCDWNDGFVKGFLALAAAIEAASRKTGQDASDHEGEHGSGPLVQGGNKG
jgi:hypothetical protein